MQEETIATFGNVVLTNKYIRFTLKTLTTSKTQTIFLQDVSLVDMNIKSHPVFLIVAAICFLLLLIDDMSTVAKLIAFGIGVLMCIAFWKIKTYTLIITPHAGAGREISCEIVGNVTKEQSDDFMEKLNIQKDKAQKNK